MPHDPNIKYVGLSMRSNLTYKDHFLSKYGRTHYRELCKMTVRPSELLVDASRYGPGSESTESLRMGSHRLRRNVDTFAEAYFASTQYKDQWQWLQRQQQQQQRQQQQQECHDAMTTTMTTAATTYKREQPFVSPQINSSNGQIQPPPTPPHTPHSDPPPPPALQSPTQQGEQPPPRQQQQQSNPRRRRKHQMTLTPTCFWYDNTHICETAHYRDFIFHPPYRMVARGGFVEDKLSPMIAKTVERLGSLREGHGRFGCYLLDDHSGYYFIGHLDGGNYLTEEQKREERRKWDSAAAAASSQSSSSSSASSSPQNNNAIAAAAGEDKTT